MENNIIHFEKVKSDNEKKTQEEAADGVEQALMEMSKALFDIAVENKVSEFIIITVSKEDYIGYLSSFDDQKDIIEMLKIVLNTFKNHGGSIK